MVTTSMRPRGKRWSLLTRLSTLMLLLLSLQILRDSRPLRAYFSLWRRRVVKGKHSLSLWGPVDGRVAYTPLHLSRNQFLGANMRFICFFGPLAYTLRSRIRARN